MFNIFEIFKRKRKFFTMAEIVEMTGYPANCFMLISDNGRVRKYLSMRMGKHYLMFDNLAKDKLIDNPITGISSVYCTLGEGDSVDASWGSLLFEGANLSVVTFDSHVLKCNTPEAIAHKVRCFLSIKVN